MIAAWKGGEDVIAGDGSIRVTEQTALKFSAVFGCCRVLAETFSSVGVMEYQRQENGDRKRTFDTSAYDVLHHMPNEEMSPFNYAEMGMYQLNLGGNFVSRAERSIGGDVLALIPFEHKRVAISRHATTRKLIYKYRPGGIADIEYERDKIFHIPGPSLNGITGMNPIRYAAQAIKLGLTYETFGIQYYENGALPTGMFKHPKKLGDVAYDRLKKDLGKNYKSFLVKGTPIISEDGMDYVPFDLKLIDAELLGSKKFQIEDICRIYRVPLHLVQNLDKATNNNIEHQSLEFAMYTMLPWFKRWESAANTQLLSKQERKAGYYLEYNMGALLRGDSKSMADAFARGRQWGWLSVNDIRRMLNMNRIPNGDIYMQPINMDEAGVSRVDEETKKIADEVHRLIQKSREE